MREFWKRMNVVAECRASGLSPWSCPPFLFVVMGLIDIGAMITSYLLSSRFVDEPEIAALIVIGVSLAIFIIGNFIIHGFNQIAAANRTKAEFIAIVSHQLRSPLSVFKWTVDAIIRAAPPPPPGSSGAPTYLDILRENSERMLQLVNMLLEVSRIDAGRMVLSVKPVRLGELAEEVTRSVEPYARGGGVRVELACPVGLPQVRADREKVKMVIQNLIDNAVRYTPTGGRVAVAIAPHGADAVELVVTDTGRGIPSSAQHLIFQKFFRAGGVSERGQAGSGLGLYIARSVITALGGEIGFSSREGVGSNFWFRLPVWRAEHA